MKLKQFSVPVLPMALVLAVLRIVSLLRDSKLWYFVYGAATLACCLYLIAVLIFAKKSGRPFARRLARTSMFDIVIASLGGLCIIIGNVYEALNKVLNAEAPVPFWKAPSFWMTILAVASVVFAVFYTTYPKSCVKNVGWQIYAAVPAVWYALRTLFAFLDFDLAFSRSVGIYTICFYGFSALSWFWFAEVLANMDSRKPFAAFTWAAVILCVSPVVCAAFSLTRNFETETLLQTVGDLLWTALLYRQVGKTLRSHRQ